MFVLETQVVVRAFVSNLSFTPVSQHLHKEVGSDSNQKRDSSERLKGKINFNAFAKWSKDFKTSEEYEAKTTWGSQKPQVVSEMHPVVVEVSLDAEMASFRMRKLQLYNFQFSQGCPMVNLKGGSRVNKQR